MTMTTTILASILTFAVCLLHVEGDVNCRVEGTGKMVAFSNAKINVKIPCKYVAVNYECQGYRIKVVPQMAMDSKYRYFTKSIWVSIHKSGTDFYWKGRTSTKHVARYMEEPSRGSLFTTKDEQLTGAGFNVMQSADYSDYSTTLSVSNADFEITFFAYDENDKSRRKNSGVEITCPDATYTRYSDYPQSLCGNGSDFSTLRFRKKELGFRSKTRTVLYDILDNDAVVQVKPQCDVATQVFRDCPVDRSGVINACHKIVTSGKIKKCLRKYLVDPMDALVYCVKYVCHDDNDSRDLLVEALEGCPKIPAIK